ncbi:MAG TPA: OmpH family outer membrane protein [Pyrinomonadaceae bacterium]|nr:OmpH family outer membrane protein [Pyrinomonadaceae bacterium]
MKTVRLIAVSFIFAAFFAVSAFAQTGAAQTGTFKFAVIDTGMFGGDEKGVGGITKYVNAMNTIEAEFKPLQTDLQTMQTKLQTLAAEIEKMRNPPQGVPVNTSTLQTKIDEAQNLDRDLKRKQEDAKARFEKRQGQLLGPIMQDIYKAMQEFTMQKGYAMIFDGAQLDNQRLVVAFDPAKADVTKEFITFYNARPAGAATAAAPK